MEPTASVTYQYQILRYRHDYFSGEFVNVGLVYFDPQTGFLQAAFEDAKYSRLTQFFGEKVQGGTILKMLKGLKKRTAQMTSDPKSLHFEDVAQLTTSLLPPDDNGLYFSEVFKGWHFDHTVSFQELYDRIIGSYQDQPIKRHDDAYAWKNVYKKHFDRLNVTPMLHAHKVVTSSDAFNFQHAAKNGAWHCLQSITFDLKHENSIKDKIYRWKGIIQEMATSKEPIHLYLLSLLPQDKEMVTLISKQLNQEEGNVQVTLVTEDKAEKTALYIKKQLTDVEHYSS